MPDENAFTLRQVDQARADFAAVLDELVKALFARLTTRREVWRVALMGVVGGASLMQTLAFIFRSLSSAGHAARPDR